MPLVPHEFDPEEHIYKVRGHYVLATSDVISLNGLSLLQGVPPETLAWASRRGVMVHASIQAYEEDRELPEVTDEAHERFLSYLRWKDATGFRVCGPLERTVVYQHHGTEMMIGATPDLIGYIGDALYVVDVKTCFRQSGKAKQMKCLEWRMQLQSYAEALAEDEDLWETLGESQSMRRGLLHLHPDCGIEKRGAERLGYEFYDFTNAEDDALWDSMVRVAYAKIANGHKRPERE